MSFLESLLLLCTPGFALGQEVCPQPASTSPGFYSDRAAYDPGESIVIHAGWPAGPQGEQRVVTYHLLRIHDGPVAPMRDAAGNLPPLDPTLWQELTSAGPFTYAALESPSFGSYVEFPSSLDLSGTTAFTIEGWLCASWVPRSGRDADRMVVAGQTNGRVGTGIVIDSTGRLQAHARVVAPPVTGRPAFTGQVSVRRAQVIERDRWYYVAATYDGSGGQLRLHVAEEGTCLTEVSSRPVPGGGPLAASKRRFRMGSAGGRYGFDGRLDAWSVWSRALAREELASRMAAGDPSVVGCSQTPPSPAGLELRIDFEDDHATITTLGFADASGNGRRGQLIQHGTPGLTGRNGGRALRLNYDQVVDARFPGRDVNGVPTEIPLPARLASGLYAVEARVDGVRRLRDPTRYQCIVVRPVTPPAAGTEAIVAVLVPVNTWLAYNPWPAGGRKRPGAGGLRHRHSSTGECLPQGRNSHYSRMGDGASFVHYGGWRRPNVYASPIEDSINLLDLDYSNRDKAPMNARFFQWLARPTAGRFDGGAQVACHAFTDWDLDAANFLVDEDGPVYPVLMLSGHPEYWSRRMLLHLVEYVAAGGNVITVGGNNIVWRSELAHVGSPDNVVLEVKKWPRANEVGQLGLLDRESFLDPGTLAGQWRALNQCGAVFGGPWDLHDYVLGTLLDIAGWFGAISADPVTGALDLAYGEWRAADLVPCGAHPGRFESRHPLWTGACFPPSGLLPGVGRVVGGEADSHIEKPLPYAPRAAHSSLDPADWTHRGSDPETIPAHDALPFCRPGSFTVLATGANFGQRAGQEYRRINLRDPVFRWSFDCTDSAPDIGNLFFQGNEDGPGSIVYYEYEKDGVAGGKVLTVGSIDSVWGLRNHADAENNALSILVENALNDFLGL